MCIRDRVIIIIIGIGKVEEILTMVEDTKIMTGTTGIITGAMKRGGTQNGAGAAKTVPEIDKRMNKETEITVTLTINPKYTLYEGALKTTRGGTRHPEATNQKMKITTGYPSATTLWRISE